MNVRAKIGIECVIDVLPICYQCILRRKYYKIVYPSKYRELQRMRIMEKSSGYSFRPYLESGSIFVHIPKCAGVSICRSLFGNLAGGHTTIKEYQVAFTPTEFRNFFKFTIVRNPWDRLLSAYNFLKNGGFNETDRQWAKDNLSEFSDFNEFVAKWVNNKNIYSYWHFVPQHKYIFVGRRPAIDFLGRFETLKKDCEYIAERLGVDLELEHMNKGHHYNYRDVYSKSSAEIVRHVYSDDIEVFGYTY